jgi:hypothetical protein
MSKGTYSADVHAAASTFRAVNSISDFAYSDSGATAVHDTMSPAGLDGKGAKREARDSAEYPRSRPVAVFQDVTGSMADVPRMTIKELPKLMGLLLRKSYLTDPQIMFGAIGDATALDRAPLQVGQFEADNKIDESLGMLLLEGGGGGGMEESYQLALYFMARRVVTDAWEKRGEKGYLFIIGDEKAYSKVSRREVADVIGETIQDDIPLETIMAEVLERWNIFYILPAGASHVGNTDVLSFWRHWLGQNVIELADLGALCETIALTIGLTEDTVDLDSGLDDLKDVGSDAGGVVGKALATIGAGATGGGLVTAPPPGALDQPSGNERL